MIYVDEFTRWYISTALWSSTDDNDDPLDQKYGIESLASETLQKMLEDCSQFQKENHELYDDPGSAGHDFWLTRNGHGAGFWDGDYPEPNATRLTEASHRFGEVHLYVGDDEKIHQE